MIHPQFLELNRVETYTQVYICVEFTQQDSQKKRKIILKLDEKEMLSGIRIDILYKVYFIQLFQLIALILLLFTYFSII